MVVGALPLVHGEWCVVVGALHVLLMMLVIRMMLVMMMVLAMMMMLVMVVMLAMVVMLVMIMMMMVLAMMVVLVTVMMPVRMMHDDNGVNVSEWARAAKGQCEACQGHLGCDSSPSACSCW